MIRLRTATTEAGNNMPNVSAEPKEGILKSRTPSASRIAGTDSSELS